MLHHRLKRGLTHASGESCMFLSFFSRERQIPRDGRAICRERESSLAVRLGIQLCQDDVQLMSEALQIGPRLNLFFLGSFRGPRIDLDCLALSSPGSVDPCQRGAVEMLTTCFLDGSHTTSWVGPFFGGQPRRVMKKQCCYDGQGRSTK